MRTTIEISDKHRSALLSLAAQKGLRGYSKIIEEAIDDYIANQTKSSDIKKSVLALKGSWKKDSAHIKNNIRELRKNWEKS